MLVRVSDLGSSNSIDSSLSDSSSPSSNFSREEFYESNSILSGVKDTLDRMADLLVSSRYFLRKQSLRRNNGTEYPKNHNSTEHSEHLNNQQNTDTPENVNNE